MSILPFDKIVKICPQEIKDYLSLCEKTPQSPEWHPEAPNDEVPHNVYKHTKIVYERARMSGDINLSIAALFHDLGKANATTPSPKKEGVWNAYGHEYVSAKIVEEHKDWIEEQGANWEEVYQIVYNHMKIKFIMRPNKQQALKDNPIFNKIEQFSSFDDMKNLTEDELNI